MANDPIYRPGGKDQVVLPHNLRDRAYEWANRNAAAAAAYQKLDPKKNRKQWDKIRKQYVRTLVKRLQQSPKEITDYFRNYDQDAPHDLQSLRLPLPKKAPIGPARPPGTFGGFPNTFPPV